MTSMHKIFLCLVLYFQSTLPNFAAPLETSQTLQDLENYIHSIDSLQGKFSQSSLHSPNKNASGILYLEKIHKKLRIEYAPPFPLLILNNQDTLTYIDKNLKQITYVALQTTPLYILFEPHFSFTKDPNFHATSIKKKSHDTLDATVIEVLILSTNTNFLGELNLKFLQYPSKDIVLMGWDIVDAQDITTSILFHTLTTNIVLPKSLFQLDPQIQREFDIFEY